MARSFVTVKVRAGCSETKSPVHPANSAPEEGRGWSKTVEPSACDVTPSKPEGTVPGPETVTLTVADSAKPAVSVISAATAPASVAWEDVRAPDQPANEFPS